jgi:cellulose synthase/poly-beta-1,6-N-acetylglucosamine synthase-like glycosyltransferase
MFPDPVTISAFVDLSLRPILHAISTPIFDISLVLTAVFSIFFYLIAIDGLVGGRKRERSFPPLKALPKITIQIPTFNEPVAIRCAERCLEMDYPKRLFNIIIGDDSNKPEISKMIDSFAAKHRGRVSVTRRGENVGFKAGNLNYMLKHGKNNEILVLFDSDFVPPKSFLREVVKPFSDEKVAFVQARWQFLNPAQNMVSTLASSILYMYHHLVMTTFNSNGFSLLCGSAEAVRKSTLQKLGGWEAGSLTEDTEYSLRCLKSGNKGVYLHNLEAKGEVPFSVKGFKRQQMRWAYGTTSAYMKHAKAITKSSLFNKRQKLFMSFVLFGYLTSPLLAVLFISGIISFFTNPPAPIDLMKFSFETGRNLLVISGFLFAGMVAMHREKMLLREAPKLILSSVTAGIYTSFFVAKAFFKAVAGRPMTWYLIQKSGNAKFFSTSHVTMKYK